MSETFVPVWHRDPDGSMWYLDRQGNIVEMAESTLVRIYGENPFPQQERAEWPLELAKFEKRDEEA